ncbi:MAG: alkyl sulfatase C-terminal domain-containing protein [Woeseiaceae bacterium]
MNRADLEPVMMQQTTLGGQIRDGKASLEGSALILARFASTLGDFDPVFEMMPGTR